MPRSELEAAARRKVDAHRRHLRTLKTKRAKLNAEIETEERALEQALSQANHHKVAAMPTGARAIAVELGELMEAGE